MSSRVIFFEIISEVSGSGSPIDAEHFLRFFASHPIKAHVPRLASLALHVIITYTMGSGVVRLDERLPLRMAHLNQRVTCWYGFSRVKKDSPHLCLYSARHHGLNSICRVEYRSVVGQD